MKTKVFSFAAALFILTSCGSQAPVRDHYRIYGGTSISTNGSYNSRELSLKTESGCAGYDEESCSTAGKGTNLFGEIGVQKYFTRHLGLQVGYIQDLGNLDKYQTRQNYASRKTPVEGSLKGSYIPVTALFRLPLSKSFSFDAGLGAVYRNTDIKLSYSPNETYDNHGQEYRLNESGIGLIAQAGLVLDLGRVGFSVYGRYMPTIENKEGIFDSTPDSTLGLAFFINLGGNSEEEDSPAPEPVKTPRRSVIQSEGIAVSAPTSLAGAESQYKMGLSFYEKDEPDYFQAFEWFSKSAAAGYAPAQNKLGIMYFYGEFVAVNKSNAVANFQKAALQNEVDALYNFAYMLQRGEGIQRDFSFALSLYKRAAELNHPEAINSMGDMYYYGQGVEQDYKQALEYFKTAGNLGVAAANNNAGHMYLAGQGAEQDYAAAISYFKKAQADGYVDAYNNLGLIYLNGLGVEVNSKQAVSYFNQAAAKNSAEAFYNLGLIYLEGRAGGVNYGEAVKNFQKAAQQNHMDAKYKLGFMYESGLGVKQDYVLAMQWYQQASQYEGARFKIGQMYEKGYGVEPNYEQAMYWYNLAAEDIPEAKAAGRVLEKRGMSVQDQFAIAIAALTAKSSMPIPKNSTVAVMPLNLEGDEKNTSYFTDLFDVSVSARKEWKVVERRKINTILKEMQFNMTMGDGNAVYEFISADFLFSGSIYLKGGKYEFVIKLTRAEKAEVISQTTVVVDKALGL